MSIKPDSFTENDAVCSGGDDLDAGVPEDAREPLLLLDGQGLDGQPRRTGGVAGQVQAGLDAGDVVDGLQEVADRPQGLPQLATAGQVTG